MKLFKTVGGRRKLTHLITITLGFFALQGLFINATPANFGSQKRFVKGRVLVQPKAGLSQEKLDKVLSMHNGKSKSKISQINVHLVEVPAGAEEAIAEALSHHPDVKFAEVDAILEPTMVANDPYFASEWHLAKIGAPAAWDMTQGTGVVVAVLDSGIDSTHPDLATQIVPGWNIYDNNNILTDVTGHGTATAGVVAAAGNNSVGVVGVAPGAKIMPIRICDTTGSATGSAIASGITWAVDHGAKVASISYSNLPGNSTVITAAQYMKGKGGEVVVAVANGGSSSSTAGVDIGVANSTSLIVVSSTESNDAFSVFSNYGVAVDISAPGDYIYTTLNGGGYAAWWGTSFATPVVAGVVAMMMAANPSLPPSQIESLLFATATDLGTPGYDIYFGNGRVNAQAAVQAAKAAVASDTIAPSVAFSAPLSGSIVKGQVAVNLTSSDNVAVTHVDFYVGNTLIGSDSLSPYSFSWDSTTVSDGTVTLTAKAYDSSGNIGTSSINVSVRNTIDTTAPSVNILTPSSGAVLNKSSVTISASATDNVAVSSMILYVDGVQKASAATGSLSTSLNTRKMSSGSHSIRVDAMDASGNLSSKTIQVSK